ncbi:MAG: ATP-binding protein [Gemmiger sp.]|nr:ATP-binding protein [Gemmiger sp.]
MKQPESMAKKIQQRLVLVGLVSVALTALGAALLFYRAFAAQVDAGLVRTARAVAAAYTASGGDGLAALADFSQMPEFSGEIAGEAGGQNAGQSSVTGNRLRLTLIDATGEVLYDSTGKTGLENHASRPEVAAALANGSGSDTRRSDTMGFETHYYALLLGDGNVLRLADETQDVWSAYNKVLPLLVLGALLVLAVAMALAWQLTRSLVRPITEMAAHLDSIEADVPYIELEPLARTVQSDRKLQQDNEAMRREFTANVSHELKTPLTSISGYAELIENGMAKPSDVPEFAGRVRREAARMIALVTDILQLSELDGLHGGSGAAGPHEQEAPEQLPVDLAALVKELAARMTMNARKAYVTLQYKAAPATVLGSRDLLAELATNLCDNAIRYNRPGGHVQMECGTAPDGTAWLSVQDNGIGIPQEAQGRVFERFYRVDKSRSKATGGTGLGLAIVKHIALLHGARIDLKSQVGTGTTIRVVFPKV